MSDSILKLENISKVYKEGNRRLEILKDLNLDVKKGDFISIMGKSGSGKSTLLNMMGILDTPSSGNIYINGENINNLKDAKKDIMRNHFIGFVFQFHYLLPEFTALENVMIARMIDKKENENKAREKAKKILIEVGLGERLDHKPSKLSGGEKQRVAIARALINEPQILLADEPTGNLDEETSESIHKLLKKINREKQQSIIVVTHSSELARLTEKHFILKFGELKEEEKEESQINKK